MVKKIFQNNNYQESIKLFGQKINSKSIGKLCNYIVYAIAPESHYMTN